MSQLRIDGTSAASNKFFHIPLNLCVQTPRIPSGALGKHLRALPLFDGDDGGVKHAEQEHVSLQEADNALRKLTGSLSAGSNYPTVRDVLEMDPMMLSMMMTQLVLKVSASNANALSQQLERTTEVQAALRTKQIEEYQEQIKKSVEQADKARKAQIANVIFDWIISGIEAVAGVMKMVEGVLTCDPVAFSDGVAYCAAGVAGMVKAGAETAELLGADKSTCDRIIKTAGTAQSVCEGVAMALDMFQIGRGLNAARTIVKATEDVLESGVGKDLIDAIAKGSEEEVEVLAEKVAQDVSRVMENFEMPLEREMVEVADMAAEAEAYGLKAEANMVRRIGKSFTRKGVAELVKTTIEDVGKELLEDSGEVSEKTLHDAILKKLNAGINKAISQDFLISYISQAAHQVCKGLNKSVVAIIALKAAQLERAIEHLIVQQDYIDFMQNWTEDRKKTQQKRLREIYQDGANAMKIASEIIDNSGTVLANIAGHRV